MHNPFLYLFILCWTFSVSAGIKIQHNNQATSIPTKEQLNVLTQLRSQGNETKISWNEFNATPTFLVGKLTAANYIMKFSSPVSAALQFIDDYKVLFKLNSPTEELIFLTNQMDQIGMTHVKFNQVYQGLTIKGSQLIVHFDIDGSISCVNGRFIPTPDISLKPSVTQNAATQIASAACANQRSTVSELIIYVRENKPTLAYKISVPTVMTPMQYVIIDASKGEVLEVDSGIRYDGPTTGTGIGLNGLTRNLNIYQATNKWGVSGTTYFLIDASKPLMYNPPVDSFKGVIDTYDANNDTSNYPYSRLTYIYDLNADRNFNDNERMKAGVDAHYSTGEIYNYYLNHFNRNSWNNQGGSLSSVVHYQINFNNAFWNGSFMTYGDGDGFLFSNFAGALDVIAHELTHGVTQATANLEYRGQSGALNESYSDVFASMVDSTDWLIGEDIVTMWFPSYALRDMADPHMGKTADDQLWQPAYMNEYVYLLNEEDHGGVHINSGIPNKACYLVATAIGRQKTEQIYYRTLVYYLTNQSQFIDARHATLQSSIDFFGIDSPEYNVVAAAFDSVGIISTLPRTYELAYDFGGTPSTGCYEPDANWGIVNQFLSPGVGKLVSISFYYYGENNPNGNGSFRIQILSDSTVLYVSPVIQPTDLHAPNVQYKGWLSLPLLSNNITVSGNFWAGIFYDGTNQPMIGLDTIANGHAWEWDATQSKWIYLDQNSYFPSTFYMRAIVNTVTDVEVVENETPTKFTLNQNYPNPFNPSTVISYQLSAESWVTLKVYNIFGQEIITLVNNLQQAGYKSVQFDAKAFASGVYLYHLHAVGIDDPKQIFSYVKKMIVLK